MSSSSDTRHVKLLSNFRAFLSRLPIPPNEIEAFWLEAFEERAAIMHYDGGLEVHVAEKMAFDSTYHQYRASR